MNRDLPRPSRPRPRSLPAIAACVVGALAFAPGGAFANDPPKPAPSGQPLDNWDEPGNETGDKAPVRAGLPPPDARTDDRRPANFGQSRSQLTESERRRVQAAAREKVEAYDFGNKLVAGVSLRYRSLSSDLDVGTVTNGHPPPAESGFAPTIRLGYNPTSSFSITAEGSVLGSRFEGVPGDATFVSLRGALALYVPFDQFRPYVCAIGGVEWMASELPGIRSDYDFAVGGGVGVQWEMSNWIGLRLGASVIGTDGAEGLAQIYEIGAGVEVRFMPTGGN